MSLKEKICPHKPSSQITTTHGLFCLDCGHLDEKAQKNKSIIHKHQPSMDLDAKSKVKKSSPKIIPHNNHHLDAVGQHIKISMADITPKKRPS